MAVEPHILILTPGFPADESDTSCIPPLQILLKKLKDKHPALKLSVISFQYPHRRGEYQWHGIPVYACGGKGVGFPFRLSVWNRAWSLFRKINARQKVSVLHSFWFSECALVGNLISHWHQVPHFTTFMGQDALPTNKYLKYTRIRSENTIFLSPFHLNTIRNSTGISPKFLIPWAIDPADFPSLSPERNIDLLGVGSLIPLKKYEDFVQIVHKLKKTRPGIKAVLIGDGPERPKIEQLISSLGLTDNIRLTGQLSRPEVLEYMSRSEVFLHPSSYESFGMVNCEALFAGMVVVSRKTGYFVASNHWRLVNSLEEMQNAVDGFLDSDRTGMRVEVNGLKELIPGYLRVWGMG